MLQVRQKVLAHVKPFVGNERRSYALKIIPLLLSCFFSFIIVFETFFPTTYGLSNATVNALKYCGYFIFAFMLLRAFPRYLSAVIAFSMLLACLLSIIVTFVQDSQSDPTITALGAFSGGMTAWAWFPIRRAFQRRTAAATVKPH